MSSGELTSPGLVAPVSVGVPDQLTEPCLIVGVTVCVQGAASVHTGVHVEVTQLGCFSTMIGTTYWSLVPSREMSRLVSSVITQSAVLSSWMPLAALPSTSANS